MFYIAFGLLKLQQKYVFIEINFCDCCLQHSGLLLHGKASWEETTLQHFLQSLFSIATTSMYVCIPAQWSQILHETTKKVLFV